MGFAALGANSAMPGGAGGRVTRATPASTATSAAATAPFASVTARPRVWETTMRHLTKKSTASVWLIGSRCVRHSSASCDALRRRDQVVGRRFLAEQVADEVV